MPRQSQNGRREVPDSEFVSRRRAADLCELSMTAIKSAVRSGRLPAYRVFFDGRKRYRVLIKRAELIQFVTNERYDPATAFRSDGYISPKRRRESSARAQEVGF